MDLARRYAFNLPWGAIALGVVFYGALSGYMAHLANDFDGVIHLFLIVLSVMSAVLAFIMMTRRLVFPRVLELAEDAILFPHGFPRTRITRMPYADIIRMTESGVGGQGGLNMATAQGSFKITASYLPDIESYHAARDFVSSKASIVMTHHDKLEPSDWRIWGFPEPILRWVEPEDWPRYRTRLAVSKPLQLRLSRALWFFVRCFGIFFIPWLLLRVFDLPTAPVFFFCASIFGTFLITFVYHWSATIYPVHSTEISFREKGVTQFFGKQIMDWNYHNFSGWAVVERQFERRVLHIVLLKGRTQVAAFALPDTDTRERLVQLFHDKHIPHSPDLRPPWETHL